MTRAVLVVLDSVGVGGAPDARAYGDDGSDTVGHVAGWRDAAGSPLRVPHLARLGLGIACRLATGRVPPGLACATPQAAVGIATERSAGKDTPSGHWELAGVPRLVPATTFPRTVPCFPASLVSELCALTGIEGLLGQKHASGTDILDELGARHLETGMPIAYTSTDSVMQIAAHEDAFGLERLDTVCREARRLLDPLGVDRVIARPFVGDPVRGFTRTANRRDHAMPPPGTTLLDLACEAGREVVSIGKIADIFAHRGVGRVVKAAGNAAVLDAALDALDSLADGGLVVANLVDFDTEYGHRRDVAGYAEALEAFDARLPELEERLLPGDVAIITADHGCDPTWHGTDHTREAVPIIAFGPGLAHGILGRRDTFADVGATLADHLGLPPTPAGISFEKRIRRPADAG